MTAKKVSAFCRHNFNRYSRFAMKIDSSASNTPPRALKRYFSLNNGNTDQLVMRKCLIPDGSNAFGNGKARQLVVPKCIIPDGSNHKHPSNISRYAEPPIRYSPRWYYPPCQTASAAARLAKGIVTLVSRLFLVNTACPMEVTLFGMVTLVSWFLANAPFLIEVTLPGMVTLVSWLFLNAALQIAVTGIPRISEGICTSLFLPLCSVIITPLPEITTRKFPSQLPGLAGVVAHATERNANIAAPITAIPCLIIFSYMIVSLS